MPNSYHVKLFKLIHSVPPYVYWRIKIGLYNVNFGPFIIILYLVLIQIWCNSTETREINTSETEDYHTSQKPFTACTYPEV